MKVEQGDIIKLHGKASPVDHVCLDEGRVYSYKGDYISMCDIESGLAQVIKRPDWANYEVWEDGSIIGWIEHNEKDVGGRVLLSGLKWEEAYSSGDHAWHVFKVYGHRLLSPPDYTYLVRVQRSTSPSEAVSEEVYTNTNTTGENVPMSITEALRVVDEYCTRNDVEMNIKNKGVDWIWSDVNMETVSLDIDDELEDNLKALERVNDLMNK